jgi:uncharacterized membrane protein
MKYIKYILMAVVSFVVINVWFFRFNNPTIYRGGKAANMIEEFAVYGLSETIVYVIGLLIGFVNRKAILPSAALMGALMLGAVFMHFKVSDEAIKFLPAGLMLLFSLTIILINKQKQLS